MKIIKAIIMSLKEKVVPYMVYYFKKFSKTIFFKKIELQHLILVCDYFFYISPQGKSYVETTS